MSITVIPTKQQAMTDSIEYLNSYSLEDFRHRFLPHDHNPGWLLHHVGSDISGLEVSADALPAPKPRSRQPI